MDFKNSDIWGESHIGCTRKNNEDRFLIKKISDLMILTVADGMGGHAGGEIAAQIVVDTFREYQFTKKDLKKDLKTALEKAQNRIRHKSIENSDLEDMGTTATTAVIYKNKVFWIHVGDCRIYLCHQNKIRQVTTDHRFIQDLIEDDVITLEQAKTHPLKDVLDQCVGCEEMLPDTGVINIQENDRLLLCSDGLTRHLSDLQIESILTEKSVQQAGDKLIRTALEMGGTDNITVVVKEFNIFQKE